MLTEKPTLDYRIVVTPRELEAYWSQYVTDTKIVAMDTEASGLNVCKAALAGFSLSLQQGTAVYVPWTHVVGPKVEAINQGKMVDFLRQKEEWKFLFYNAKFDLSILETNLKWWPKNFLDVIELVYLEDPDRQTKTLKAVAEKDVNFPMTKFEELFTQEEIKAKTLNITRKDSKRCRDYACADADATLRIFEHPRYQKVLKEQSFAVRVDTALVEVIRRTEYDGGLELRPDYINMEIAELEKRAEAFKEQIWRISGTKFEIDSPKQLGDVLFDRMGIDSGGKTKTGQHKTDADTMDALREANPIVEFVISYRKVAKAKGTYFAKLKKLVEEGIEPRFNFNMYSAPTFRLSAPGGSPTTDGATGVNIQAVSNGEARELFAVDLTGSSVLDKTTDWGLTKEEELFEVDELFGKRPVLSTGAKAVDGQYPYVLDTEEGIKVCVRETCLLCPSHCEADGIDVTRRLLKGILVVPSVRNAFQAPKGFVLIAVDYDKQELMIGANLSKERVWIDGLLAKVDLHEVTGALAFGVPDMSVLSAPEYKRVYDIGKML